MGSETLSICYCPPLGGLITILGYEDPLWKVKKVKRNERKVFEYDRRDLCKRKAIDVYLVMVSFKRKTIDVNLVMVSFKHRTIDEYQVMVSFMHRTIDVYQVMVSFKRETIDVNLVVVSFMNEGTQRLRLYTSKPIKVNVPQSILERLWL